MWRKLLWCLTAGIALLAAGCGGRSGLYLPAPDAAPAGIGLRLPPGGLAALLGDAGIPGVGVIADLVCGPEVKSGARCAGDVPGCALSSLGGVCVCLGSTWLCPQNTNAGPTRCPANAATGTACTALLTTCLGGSTVGCLCGVGTYVCF